MSPEKKNNNSETELDQLRKQEERALHSDALQRENAEIQRRRQELEDQITELRENLRTQWKTVKTELDEVVECLQTVEELDPEHAEGNPQAVHRNKKLLHQAEMGLMKITQDHFENSKEEKKPDDVAERSFLQLTRVGFALTWPLLLAILLGTGLVIGTLMKLFTF